jgi:methionyl-tRNA synthetase
VRRLNRYVEEQAPWQLAKDPERAEELDRVLASLFEGVRIVTVLLHPYLPASTGKLLDALGRPETAIEAARCVVAPIDVQALEPLFPKR